MPYPWSAGNVLNAADLNDAIGDVVTAYTAADSALDARLDTLESTGWTDWSSSFTWAASSVNPTKGNSVYTARYKTMPGLVIYHFNISIGNSGFAAGTGTYQFGVPFNGADLLYFGSGHVIDSSPLTTTSGMLSFGGGSAAYLEIYRDGASAALGATSITWASGDQIRGSIMYRPA